MKSKLFPKQTFVVHPQNQPFIDGKVNRPVTFGAKTYFWRLFFSILTLIIGFAILIFGFNELRLQNFLNDNGVKVLANITDLSSSFDHETTSYSITYQFYDQQNNLITNRQNVNDEIYYNYDIGEQIEVVFMPNDPQTNRLSQSAGNTANAPIPIIIFGVVMLLFSIILTATAIDQLLKIRTIQNASGKSIIATITHKAITTNDDSEPTTLTLTYEFSSPKTNKTNRKKVSVVFRNENPFKVPELGDPLVIWYVNESNYDVV
jgi:hypothetical protein